MDIDIFERVNNLVALCEETGVNLCGSFDDWTDVGFALADLGENGRDFFHRLSAMDSRYKERECDKKFDHLLRTRKSIHIGTLFHHAKDMGVDLSAIGGAAYVRKTYTPRKREPGPPKTTPDYVDAEWVTKSESTSSTLYRFLLQHFEASDIDRVWKLYHMGATKDGCPIYWQIDAQGNVRTGKIIIYHNDGHRDKSKKPIWIHNVLKQRQELPTDFNMEQCLFGEHLLSQFPTATIALVEAEKTALICAMQYTGFVWLATGTKSIFSPDRLRQLKGRKVIVFPDTDALQSWKDKAKDQDFAAHGLNVTISDYAARRASAQQIEAKCDIADLLLSDIAARGNRLSNLAAQYPPLQILINGLNLIEVRT